MNNSLVKVNLHHELGEEIGQHWELAVNSVAEAVRAIEAMTHKFYKYLLSKDKENIGYQIIVNGNPLDTEGINQNNLESIKNSELCLQYEKLHSIDIIPIIEGANSKTLGFVLAAILIVVGVVISVLSAAEIGIPLIISGLGLLVTTLLSKPPKFEDFREIDQGGKTSYLYGGPANIVGEGGPVPVGYGRLIVGSQTVTASYVIREFDAGNTSSYYNNVY